ncbi:MAG: HEAT repeat domain-containing protein, partial [Planctomycetes bacterium]|nr:HEAT repeat domain-containing protein [Planctomycetota bacterium]
PVVDAYSALEAQLNDRQPQVRDDALISLGLLGTESARLQLHKQAERPEAGVRAAAVRGLGWSGAGIDEFASLAADESSKVRQSVVEQLARFPSARTALLLRELLTDRDSQVQQAVVRNVERWPDQLALPLLLYGLRDGFRPTRQQAFTQIRRRRTITTVFSVFDSPRRDERVRPVVDLASRLGVSLEYLDQLRSEQVGRRERPDPVRVGDIEADVRVVTDLKIPQYSPEHIAALSRLKRLQPGDVKIIEDYLLETSDQNALLVYQELLPTLSTAHQALLDLQQKDLQLRRRGALRLRELSADRSLSRLVVRRLSKYLDNKQDVLVWRDAMAAVMPDAGDENAQIALRALNDDRPEIRLLGCRYVLRHPSPQYAAWLMQLRLFHDADKRVRLVAIKAAGRSGNLRVVDDLYLDTHPPQSRPNGSRRLPGLRSLLTDSDSDIRMAAVISMCHLADQQAMQELIRLSWNSDTQIRIQAVRAMGETEISRFLGPLIRLGWTERHSDVRRSLLASLQQLTLPGKRPADLYDESRYDDKIKAWLDWWEQKQRRIDRVRNAEVAKNGKPRAESREPEK